MKSTLLSLALVFAASTASASTVAILSNRVQTVVTTAGVRANVATSALARINAAGAIGVSAANISKLETVVTQIEDSFKAGGAGNDNNLNGIPKAKRLEAILLAYVALVKNFSEGTPNADLERVLRGELFMRSVAPVSGNLGEAQYNKFIDVMKMYVEQNRSAEDASRAVTGDTLAAFANACGAAARR